MSGIDQASSIKKNPNPECQPKYKSKGKTEFIFKNFQNQNIIVNAGSAPEKSKNKEHELQAKHQYQSSQFKLSKAEVMDKKVETRQLKRLDKFQNSAESSAKKNQGDDYIKQGHFQVSKKTEAQGQIVNTSKSWSRSVKHTSVNQTKLKDQLQKSGKLKITFVQFEYQTSQENDVFQNHDSQIYDDKSEAKSILKRSWAVEGSKEKTVKEFASRRKPCVQIMSKSKVNSNSNTDIGSQAVKTAQKNQLNTGAKRQKQQE